MLSLLLIAGVETLDLFLTTAPVPTPASRFLRYFESLERTGQFGSLENVLFSWMLTRSR